MVNNETVLIVTGGRPISGNRLKDLYEKCDFVIAADSGLKALADQGLKPHLIVGDFDSVEQGLMESRFSDVKVLSFPPEKDYTDTELAVYEAMKMPCETIYIAGGIGTRMDHSLANMMILQAVGLAGKRAVMIDDHNAVEWIEKGTYAVKSEQYDYFSLVPLSERICVSLEGFKYPLDHRWVKQESTLTISNEWLNTVDFPEGIVTLHEGRALLIKAID